ncbi:MAG: hypothetical protein JO297_19590 [Nitrososphaeraceae archaeon]|nr:hypothetical protein [Nitrososphaeraceae archaeon]
MNWLNCKQPQVIVLAVKMRILKDSFDFDDDAFSLASSSITTSPSTSI